VKAVSRGVFAASIIVAIVVSCLATIGIYSHVYHPLPRTVTVPTTVTRTVTKTVTSTVLKTATTTVPATVTSTSRTTVTRTLLATKTVTSVSTVTATRIRTVTIGGVVVREIPVIYAHLFKLWNATKFIIAEDAEHQLFILVPRGSRAPSNATISAVVKGLGIKPRRIFVVRVPIERGVFLSTTEVALLYRVAKAMGNLSMLDTVVGVSYSQWWIPVIPQLLKSGRAKVVATYSGVNYEAILALKPDVVFMYTGFPAMEKALAKLESLGLKVAVDNEWLENSYLARFEWIKFIAAFYGPKALEKAIEIFNHVAEIHNELVLALRQYAEITGKHPTFLWFYPSLKWGIWAPKRGAYPIKYLESIGARYVLASYVPNGTGSTPINKELIAKVACKADVWIISGSPPYIDSIDDIAKVLGSWIYKCPAVENHRVYFYSPSYWQLGYAYTELVLKDLASIMYPSAPILRGYERTFFHHLWRKGVSISVAGVSITYEGFYKVIRDASGRKWIVVPFDLASYVPKSVAKSASGFIELPVKRIATDLEGLAAAYALGLSSRVALVATYNRSLVPPSLLEAVKSVESPSSVTYSELRKLGVSLVVASEPIARELEARVSGVAIVSLPSASSIATALDAIKVMGALLDLDYLAQSYVSYQQALLTSVRASTSLVPKASAVCIYITGRIVHVATNASIIAQLAEAAGARYLARARSPWETMSLSSFAKKFSSAQVLIVLYPRFANISSLERHYPQLATVAAIKSHRVIAGLGLYILFYALSEPGTLAKDLAACLHPSLYPHYTPRFFARLP